MLKNLKGFKWLNGVGALVLAIGTAVLTEPVLAEALPKEVVAAVGVVIGLLTKFYPKSGE